MGLAAQLLATVMGVTPVAGTAATEAATVVAVQQAQTSPTKDRASPRRRARGGSGTRINSGFIDDLDPNTEVRGPKWYGEPTKLGIADRMIRDPQVRASVHYVRDALMAAKWKFKAASKSEIDREAAAYLNWCLIERMPWRTFVGRTVSGYMRAGFALSEVTDDYITLPKKRFPLHALGDVGLVPTGLHSRPSWSVFQWVQSKRVSSQLAGIRQWIPGSDTEQAGIKFVKADRLIRMTYDQEGANFAGYAPLRSAHGPWKIKKALEIIDAIKHERTGVGIPKIKLGPDADEEDIAAAEMVGAELRANERGFLTMPDGWDAEWLGAGEAESSDINKAILRQNIEIAMNVVAGNMLLGLSGPSGSFALSNTQDGARHLHVDGHAALFTDTINCGQDGWSLPERLTRANYGTAAGVPTLQARLLPTRPWIKIVAETVKAAAAGAITMDDQLEDDIREALEWGPHDPSTARARPVSLGTPPANSDDKDDEAREAA